MIIKHNDWSNGFDDDEFKLFYSILDKFEDKIRKNDCTWTTSATNKSYSISRITDKNYLYEYYFGDIVNQDFLNIVKEVYQTSLYTIDSKNSDIDEPITDNNEEICTYATVDIRKINCEINVYNFILMLKYHFIFKISNFLYGIPLHSEGNLKLMGRNN